MFRPQMALSALNTSAINDSFYSILAETICMLHNHPSGDPTPSRADVEMTKQVVQAGRALNVEVHDHLVVGRDGVASLKQLGLM